MHELFEGKYSPEEGSVSEDALETFKEHAPRLGDKCELFIYDDWYNRDRQAAGYFNGKAFFPSGDHFSVVIVRTDGRFVLKRLKRFDAGDWEQLWWELLRDSEQHSKG
jgi:hypothetical protein